MTLNAGDEPNVGLLRAMSIEQLMLYRSAFKGDLRQAQRTPRKAKYTVEFCQAHIEAIEQVLAEKGVTTLA